MTRFCVKICLSALDTKYTILILSTIPQILIQPKETSTHVDLLSGIKNHSHSCEWRIYVYDLSRVNGAKSLHRCAALCGRTSLLPMRSKGIAVVCWIYSIPLYLQLILEMKVSSAMYTLRVKRFVDCHLLSAPRHRNVHLLRRRYLLCTVHCERPFQAWESVSFTIQSLSCPRYPITGNSLPFKNKKKVVTKHYRFSVQ